MWGLEIRAWKNSWAAWQAAGAGFGEQEGVRAAEHGRRTGDVALAVEDVGNVDVFHAGASGSRPPPGADSSGKASRRPLGEVPQLAHRIVDARVPRIRAVGGKRSR